MSKWAPYKSHLNYIIGLLDLVESFHKDEVSDAQLGRRQRDLILKHNMQNSGPLPAQLIGVLYDKESAMRLRRLVDVGRKLVDSDSIPASEGEREHRRNYVEYLSSFLDLLEAYHGGILPDDKFDRLQIALTKKYHMVGLDMTPAILTVAMYDGASLRRIRKQVTEMLEGSADEPDIEIKPENEREDESRRSISVTDVKSPADVQNLPGMDGSEDNRRHAIMRLQKSHGFPIHPGWTPERWEDELRHKTVTERIKKLREYKEDTPGKLGFNDNENDDGAT